MGGGVGQFGAFQKICFLKKDFQHLDPLVSIFGIYFTLQPNGRKMGIGPEIINRRMDMGTTPEII